MKNNKTSKTPAAVYRRHLASMPFMTKPPPGTHQAAETPDLHRSKSVQLLGHSLKPELAGLIEKTLQESEPSSTEEGAQNIEDIICLKEIKKKVHESRKDKKADHKQEESASKHTTEKQKASSLFVEIDLGDKVEEEKTEDISTEEKLLEKEEEPVTVVRLLETAMNFILEHSNEALKQLAVLSFHLDEEDKAKRKKGVAVKKDSPVFRL